MSNLWIACGERLPEWEEHGPAFMRESDNVLVYCRDTVIRVAYLHQFDADDPAYWVMQGRDGLTLEGGCEPTHWMPLPQPPLGIPEDQITQTIV